MNAQRIEATHFIEQVNTKSGKNIISAEYKIEWLRFILDNTNSTVNLYTVAVFKIKYKNLSQ